MGRSSLGLAVMILCLVGPSLAPAAGLDISVDQIDLCAAVRERTPVGVTDTFPSDISGIYCFTKIAGAKDTTAVVHAWYHGEEKIAEVELPVKSSLWRTWSRKRMLPQWQGEWKVEVVAADGSVLASKRFWLK